ncbi:stress-related protein isoform X2 [Malania oleifera]|uniref:stress-related protein isoform X2 n=1 Tax=Malania oleifera TaxID=397392 RepID=UPI0025AE28E9|nr:stress-related protein isoform X2 [Malania oleifera]
MAEAEPQQQQQTDREGERSLKYLYFVQLAYVYVVVCFSSLYGFAKKNSGPLKSGVETIEGTVKTVIGPIYEKFRDVPFELLKLADRKVMHLILATHVTNFSVYLLSDAMMRGMIYYCSVFQVDRSLTKLDRRVPPLAKQASSHAFAVASEVRQYGLADAAANIARTVRTSYGPTAKELYGKYEPVAEKYAVAGWRSLNRLPLFPQVAQVVVPTAAYWSEKYNEGVQYAAERGYAVLSYLPLVPIDRIGKVFKEGKSQ